MTIISPLVTETATETGHPATTSVGIPIDSDSSVATMPTADRVKLPKISLPIFNGEMGCLLGFVQLCHTY